MILLIVFCGYFCSFCKLIIPKFSSQFKHEESKLDSKLTTEFGRKLEPQTEGLQYFATCSASIFDFHWTIFYDFFPNCPSCFVGCLDTFVISLDSEQYISLSQALYQGSSTLCNKIGAKAFSFPAFLLFSCLLSPSFTFSPAKHLLRMTT